jgi:hypothetical protein
MAASSAATPKTTAAKLEIPINSVDRGFPRGRSRPKYPRVRPSSSDLVDFIAPLVPR